MSGRGLQHHDLDARARYGGRPQPRRGRRSPRRRPRRAAERRGSARDGGRHCHRLANTWARATGGNRGGPGPRHSRQSSDDPVATDERGCRHGHGRQSGSWSRRACWWRCGSSTACSAGSGDGGSSSSGADADLAAPEPAAGDAGGESEVNPGRTAAGAARTVVRARSVIMTGEVTLTSKHLEQGARRGRRPDDRARRAASTTSRPPTTATATSSARRWCCGCRSTSSTSPRRR